MSATVITCPQCAARLEVPVLISDVALGLSTMTVRFLPAHARHACPADKEATP